MNRQFPLRTLLKGRFLKIAELQDKLMIELSSRFNAVLHGGTAIWRVYGGNRFSFDIDVYYEKPAEILRHFRGSDAFNLIRSKITSSDVLYMRFSDDDAEVEVDVSRMFKKMPVTDGEFNLTGGGSIVVRTLGPESLLAEKLAAFSGRRKIRDLYDIFFLLDKADSSGIVRELKAVSRLLDRQPADFRGLSEIVLVGKAPDFATICRKVNTYAKD